MSANNIIEKVYAIQAKIPFRTKFERENFLFNTVEGPRLILVLCRDLAQLFQYHETCRFDWEKAIIANEMELIWSKIEELQNEYGEDIAAAVEESEQFYWAETLARKAAIEALTQKMTHDNMANMLNLPLPVYESAITKCQTYLNVVSKTTRAAERRANVASREQSENFEE